MSIPLTEYQRGLLKKINDEFRSALDSHLDAWGANCGTSRAVYSGHLSALLQKHAVYIEALVVASGAAVAPPVARRGTLTISRPIVALDFETTGVDPVTDRIVQAGFVVLGTNGERFKFETFINPETHIPEQVTAIHGITDEMVKDAPKFRDVAARIFKGLVGRDIVGFNVRRLDFPILDEEFRRCGMKLSLEGVRVIDAFSIYVNKDPRTLAAAVRKYCDRDHSEAHGAGPDAEGTLDALLGQLGMYPDLQAMTLDELHAYSLRDSNPPADLAGKLYRDADGDLRYAFGKCRDVKVKHDQGFGCWMLKQSSPGFPGDTCDVLRAELDRI